MKNRTMIDRIKDLSADKMQAYLFGGLSFLVLFLLLPKYIEPIYIIGQQMQNVFLFITSIYLGGILICLKIQRNRIIIGRDRLSSIALLCLSVFGLISCFVNGNLNETIYGGEWQGEGLITQISYYVIFLATSHLNTKRYRKGVLMFTLLVLIFVALYGVAQFFQLPFMFHKKMMAVAIYPTANQNFYAAFPVLLLGAAIAGIIYYEGKQEKRGRLIWHSIAVLAFAACLSSYSLLAYLGIIMEVLLALFLQCFEKKKKWKSIVVLLFEFIIVFFLWNVFSDGGIGVEFTTLSAQVKEEGNLFGDQVGTGRMRIWKETMRTIIHNPIVGVGEGNAHNEYLQIWVTQGTFAIIAYLIFLFALFIPGVLQFIKKDRYESDFVSKAALFAFLGYIAQAFANIRVVQAAPYFFLICGLLYIRKSKSKEEKLGGSDEM